MTYYVKLAVAIKTFKYHSQNEFVGLIRDAIWEKDEFRNVLIEEIEVDMPELPLNFVEVIQNDK